MIRRHKKNHNGEDHIDETWLIPYADLLTLLLALFIMLFASSSIDAVKFKQLADSLNSSINGGTGMMDYPSPIPKEQNQSLNKEDAKNENNKKPELEDQKLTELQTKINNYINEKKLNNEIKAELNEDGLLITILNGALFDEGKADIKIDKQYIIREISNLLVSESERKIIIAGHTDNTPIQNSSFDSNWDLSGIRSVNFLSILLENNKLNPDRFSVQGFGEYKPIETNSTVEGRAKNRRVELLIVANNYVLTNIRRRTV
ncbi:flagellar motor protein MotB [Bacillaceae bacterium CLA-AA-H227]|uniref:Flagellar motor protein MotB n=2 Tax=Robertmurraya TaxID=2837507 RepID=A0A4U1D1U9_9BACI|nr:flagellar motor protein MotB [Robertmurraya kyonggiensis]TKC15137.1 flagellar motor protein MotB [Robertmurraya kyonggiensis]